MRFFIRAAGTIFVVSALVVLIFAGYAAFTIYGDRRLPREPTSAIVPLGASGADVARLLEQRKIIGSALSFRALARLERAENGVKAGEYRFAAHQSSAEVFQRLLGGGAQVAEWITIPEGFTVRQIARTLAEHRLGDDARLEVYFLQQPFRLEGQARSRNLEGYLFPDTYLVPLESSPAQIAKIMTDQFERELPAGADARARRLGYSLDQVVTIASLVEREAKSDDERPLMAGVYYNRLKRGMRLEVDATLEYAFAHHKETITRADLARDTPYNTYLHEGLPPTPIANPGRPSLLAAFAPEPSDYLFYVYKGNGHHAFSRTLAEHNANVARYLR